MSKIKGFMKGYLLLIMIVLAHLLNGEAKAQNVISVSGGELANSSISLAFNMGDVVVGDFTNSSLSLSLGFPLSNTGVLTSNEEVTSELPAEFSLDQNYPNPFNPSTKIQYALPQKANVKIDIYNSIGVKVATVVNEDKQAGFYTATFNASSYSSGMYLYILSIDGRAFETKKMILIK